MPEAFQNTPVIDFSRRQNRAQFAQTLATVRAQFKERSRKRGTGEWLESLNPASPREIVGRVRVAGIDQAQGAIDRAEEFFYHWGVTPAKERAAIQ